MTTDTDESLAVAAYKLSTWAAAVSWDGNGNTRVEFRRAVDRG